MDKVREKASALKEELRTDATLNRLGEIASTNPKSALPAIGEYSLSKFPIIEWLPRYQPSWLLQDFVAGLTIGVMLIPQGLAYAQIATIPIENGLYSSWIPAAIAVFMGTSKDLSTGPTSILGLLTAEIIVDLQDEYTPAQISTAVALMVGVYGLILGMLELGFILDYVSVPVLTGFISATALVIGFGQVSKLIGLDDVPDGVFFTLGDVLKRLPEWDGPTCGVGFGSIFMLIILQKIGQRFGKKHFIIKYLSSSRAVIVLVIFTLISYLVNKDRDVKHYVFAVTKVHTNGISSPSVPESGLVGKVAGRAIAPFMACALEHLAVGKAFGRKNNYTIGQSQELNYLGVTNIINSFFHVMPVGGAMSRTAVNSECRVRSPLYGAITAGFIVLTLYVFSPALYWLPKSTLAAIIIMAVIHLFGPLSLFWRYWRISLADFIASMVAFWVTIFVSAEIGIGAAGGFSIVWSLVRAAFAKPDVNTGGTSHGTSSGSSSDPETGHAGRRGTDATFNSQKPTTKEIEALDRQTTFGTAEYTPSTGNYPSRARADPLPEDTAVVRFTDNIFFPNAYRGKTTALEGIQLVYPAVRPSSSAQNAERIWTVAAERRLERLRALRGVVLKDTALAVVVWDLTRVSWIDTTGIIALGELKDDIHRQLGKYVQIRMVGVNEKVRRKFWRAKWKVVDVEESRAGVEGDVVYGSLEEAIWHREEMEKGSFEGVTLEKSG
ncbi:sulfate permease [Microdochium trichocladiopsis]|uniref:Sulfate permease n=1 Tax=Microdochium trichocladiopsis TaxID=1682393 RepID=A0A9P8YIQ6_9PEZI|nr:sulfate permease [Microdochium trichocladiopsis]KAH7039760.1 sulfate permease [Microdochium trichocladiopsis]